MTTSGRAQKKTGFKKPNPVGFFFITSGMAQKKSGFKNPTRLVFLDGNARYCEINRKKYGT